MIIQHPQLTESSGLCRSVLRPGIYFSHNDSGSKPVLYAFDETGAAAGAINISATAVDIEDCSSANVGGRPIIIMADVGDNKCSRTSYRIIVINEDDPTKLQYIPFTYPDLKRRNCEAVSLLEDGRILLVTKNYPLISGPTQVFTILSFLSGDTGTIVVPGPILNKSLGTITAMDTMGKRAVLMGNGKAYRYEPVSGTITMSSLSVAPIQTTMPRTTQPEAICFSHDGLSYLMTSETGGSSLTPLHRVLI